MRVLIPTRLCASDLAAGFVRAIAGDRAHGLCSPGVAAAAACWLACFFLGGGGGLAVCG